MREHEQPTLARRGFVRSLATVPLIGSGVMLIGKPAAPIPLADIAAAPLVTDPVQRARYAWEAFAAAMRDVTAGSHGWVAQAGERIQSVGYMEASAPWLNVRAVNFEPIPRSRGGLTENWTLIEI